METPTRLALIDAINGVTFDGLIADDGFAESLLRLTVSVHVSLLVGCRRGVAPFIERLPRLHAADVGLARIAH